MKYNFLHSFILLFASGSMSATVFADNPPVPTPTPSVPTGACTITVYGITPTCTSALTEKACNTAAAKVGGVATWEKGKACPAVSSGQVRIK